MLFYISFGEHRRRSLCHAIIWINIIIELLSTKMIFFGAYITFELGRYTDLFEDYGGERLDIFLYVGGALSAVISSFGVWVCHRLFRPSKRAVERTKMMAYQMMSILIIACLTIIAGLIIVHWIYLSELFKVCMTF